MKMTAAEQVIKEWQYAYSLSNGKRAPNVNYKSGWFRIEGSAFRRNQLEKMTKNLLSRATPRPSKQ